MDAVAVGTDARTGAHSEAISLALSRIFYFKDKNVCNFSLDQELERQAVKDSRHALLRFLDQKKGDTTVRRSTIVEITDLIKDFNSSLQDDMHTIIPILAAQFYLELQGIAGPDPYHSERVGILSYFIGKDMGVEGSELADLYLSGIFHDMGKLGIEMSKLKSQEVYSPKDNPIRQHDYYGLTLLKNLNVHNSTLKAAVGGHHTAPKLDRNTIEGLVARIVCIADIFDALASERFYKGRWEVGRIISELERKTSEEDIERQVDREIVDLVSKKVGAIRELTCYSMPRRFSSDGYKFVFGIGQSAVHQGL